MRGEGDAGPIAWGHHQQQPRLVCAQTPTLPFMGAKPSVSKQHRGGWRPGAVGQGRASWGEGGPPKG